MNIEQLPEKPLVSILILNHNEKTFIKGCIESVMKQTYKNFEIFFIDNGSTDGSIDYMKQHYPKVKIIDNKKNIGVPAAINEGYYKAKGDIITICSADIIVDKNWLLESLRMLYSEKRIACVGCYVNNKGIGVINGSTNILGYNIVDVFKDKTRKFYTSLSSTFYNNLLEWISDPDYFFYNEDTYNGWLFRIKGYDVRLAPKSKLVHFPTYLHPTNTNKNVKKRKRVFKEYGYFLSERNRNMNLLLFYSKSNLLKTAPLNFMVSLARIAWNLKSDRQKALKYIKSYIWLLANMGKIIKKRKHIQKQRTVNDREITQFITSKLVNGSGGKSDAVNKVSKKYCDFVHLTCLENSGLDI